MAVSLPMLNKTASHDHPIMWEKLQFPQVKTVKSLHMDDSLNSQWTYLKYNAADYSDQRAVYTQPYLWYALKFY